MSNSERRLAAIMFTDIVGYTALTQSDESQAMQVLERHNLLLRPFFPKFRGREVKTMGDSFLVEFESALDALRCALEIQTYLHDYNISSRDEWRINLRIGIHLGDVIHKATDVLGDAVNIASRIEPIAEPEGICISGQVYDQVANKFDLPLVSLGERTLKNVANAERVYKILMPWEQPEPTREESPLPRDRLAVLPFANMSPDPADEYFADGMTEELISTVSGISGLAVISRTSVMGYKGTAKKVREIGRELEVGSVLEGSCRKAGNRIRITTQLIDVAGDRHLWSQSYDRNLDDVFEVQSDVARQVADALRVRIAPQEMARINWKPTATTSAYIFYLRGRYLWNKRGIGEVRMAVEAFQDATKEDPSFALGYVGLADSYLILLDWGLDIEANLASAKGALSRAIELAPDLAEAHTTRGLVLYDEYDLMTAEREFETAIRLKPSYASAHQWYALVLSSLARWEEAQREIEKAIELDPLSPIINLNRAFLYYFMRDYEKAAEILKHTVDLDPRLPTAHGGLGMAYGQLKKFDEMRREFDIAAELLKDAFPRAKLGWDTAAAVFEGNKETTRALLKQLGLNYRETSFFAYDLATAYFSLGELDQGFEWLERSYSAKEPALTYLKIDPLFDCVHSDKRYLDMLERLKLR